MPLAEDDDLGEYSWMGKQACAGLLEVVIVIVSVLVFRGYRNVDRLSCFVQLVVRAAENGVVRPIVVILRSDLD